MEYALGAALGVLGMAVASKARAFRRRSVLCLNCRLPPFSEPEANQDRGTQRQTRTVLVASTVSKMQISVGGGGGEGEREGGKLSSSSGETEAHRREIVYPGYITDKSDVD